MSSSGKDVADSTQTKNVPASYARVMPNFARAYSDEAALDINFRKKVIEDILSTENSERKQESLKRYEIYKDGTLRYVKEALEREISDGAVALDLMNRAADISIVKKVVNKKAKVYKSTVQRKIVEDDEDTKKKKTLVQKAKEVLTGKKAPAGPSDQQKQLDQLEAYLSIDEAMKKTNSVLELHKNCMIKIVPFKNDDGKWSFKPMILHPHQYDVVEDAGNPEKARMVILSHYVRTPPANITLWTGSRPIVGPVQNDWRQGTAKAEQSSIAGSPVDEGKEPAEKMRFIWWCSKYHFVTDQTGQIVQDDANAIEDNFNPIGILPFVSAHIDQDGSYWSLGGDDLINMAILINVLITDLNFTIKYQGAGLLYAFGHGLPKAIRVGPSRAVIWEYQEGQPEPKIGFATSSPHIGEMLQTIETQVGFMLSSNDLEVASISGQLNAGRTNSGVQELIQRSEVITAIEDKQALFRPVEKQTYKISVSWLNYFIGKGLADEELAEIGVMDADAELSVKFQAPEIFATELEKVQTLQARKLLGINTNKQLIQMDDPDLTEAQVEEQLQALADQKAQNMETMAAAGLDPNGNQAGNQGDPNRKPGDAVPPLKGAPPTGKSK